MLTDDKNRVIKIEVFQVLRLIFGELLSNVILYGSYARGDYDEESDMDIAAIVKCNRQELGSYQHLLVAEMSRLSLKYGLLINFIEIPEEDFEKYRKVMPFYRNIWEEGVILSA